MSATPGTTSSEPAGRGAGTGRARVEQATHDVTRVAADGGDQRGLSLAIAGVGQGAVVQQAVRHVAPAVLGGLHQLLGRRPVLEVRRAAGCRSGQSQTSQNDEGEALAKHRKALLRASVMIAV